jgi:glycosyltransferase involved in cell wall biosynthesis
MMVVPNGIDIDRFKPDHSAGLRVRDEWGIDEKTVSIGLIGRLDPMKDHTTFLQAVKIFDQKNAVFVLYVLAMVKSLTKVKSIPCAGDLD